MSDFETKALQATYTMTGPDDIAEFSNGTLFVECTPHTAALVESALIQALQCGVIVSKAGTEFSFDFV